MRRTVLPSVACTDLPYFHTLFHRRNNFWKKIYSTKKICFVFSSASVGEAFLVLRRIRRDIIINAHTVSYKVNVIFIRFYETLIFTTDIHKTKKKIKSNFVKIHPMAVIKYFLS